jgi:hypothetical protein
MSANGIPITAFCHTQSVTKERVDNEDYYSNSLVMFLRRLGPDPHANGAKTYACDGCPDIFELADGDFALIGSDITEIAADKLPASASCGRDERIIKIPRKTLVLAKKDIPDNI